MRRTLQMTFLLCITLVPWQLYAQDVDDMLDEAADGLFAGKSPQQSPAPKTNSHKTIYAASRPTKQAGPGLVHKGTKHIDKNYFLLSFDCNRGSRHIRTGRGRRGMGMGHGWRRRRRRGWGRGRGPGWRRGGNGHRGGHGRGMGLDTQGGLKHHRVYIHKLLNMYKKINRVLTYMPNGVKTITTSKDPKVVAAIQAHVLQMKRRMDHGAVVRRWDPFFRQLFRHYSQIKMVLKKRPDGIEVVETGKDPKVIAMIHAHAANVSAFIKKSWQEARRCHLFKQKQKQKATQ